jgi:hypothetical protein
MLDPPRLGKSLLEFVLCLNYVIALLVEQDGA